MNEYEFTANGIDFVATNTGNKLGDSDIFDIRQKSDNTFIDALVVDPIVGAEAAISDWKVNAFYYVESFTVLGDL